MFGRTPPIWLPASSAAAVAGLNPYKSAAETFVAVWRNCDPQSFAECREGLGAAGCTTAEEIVALGEAAVDPALWTKAVKSVANCRAGCAGEASTMARALPNKTITDCNAEMMIWREPNRPFAFRGYVDGICEGRVVEAKTRASAHIFDRKDPPTYDVVQCHVYMMMTSTREATFVEARGDKTKVCPSPSTPTCGRVTRHATGSPSRPRRRDMDQRRKACPPAGPRGRIRSPRRTRDRGWPREARRHPRCPSPHRRRCRGHPMTASVPAAHGR